MRDATCRRALAPVEMRKLMHNNNNNISIELSICYVTISLPGLVTVAFNGDCVTGGRIMSNTNKAALRNLLLADYGGLDRRLARRLGSADFASDVLQETYLRLEGMNEIGTVRSPKAYLFRIALNIANDRRRAESRRLTVDEVDCLLDIPDDRPDASRVIEDRSEVNLLRHAIAELPERRRRVLMLSRVEGMPHREIANHLGVTVRTVEMDLKQAVEHCAERLQRRIPAKFAFNGPRSSYVQRHVVRGRPRTTVVSGETLESDETYRSSQSPGPIDP
jgi:RNA polymerase sigma factor (sigma-70 family)